MYILFYFILSFINFHIIIYNLDFQRTLSFHGNLKSKLSRETTSHDFVCCDIEADIEGSKNNYKYIHKNNHENNYKNNYKYTHKNNQKNNYKNNHKNDHNNKNNNKNYLWIVV